MTVRTTRRHPFPTLCTLTGVSIVGLLCLAPTGARASASSATPMGDASWGQGVELLPARVATTLASRAAPEEQPDAAGVAAPAGDPPAAGAPPDAASRQAPRSDGTTPPEAAQPETPGAVAPATEPSGSEQPPPAEGPAADEYTSSKESGTALSGKETESDDGLPENRETVGDVKKEKKGLSHHKTGILGVAAGAGFGMILAGDKFCGEFSRDTGDTDKRKALCTGFRPVALDITGGFGAAPRIDVVMTVRINVMKRAYNFDKCDSDVEPCNDGKGLFNKKVAIGIMPGVRIWGQDNDKLFKVGGAIDFMYMYEDFSGYRVRPRHPDEDADPENRRDEERVGDHSIGLRGGPILQIDPHHNIGIYIIPAVVPSFHVEGPVWVEIGFEGSLGFQARFP